MTTQDKNIQIALMLKWRRGMLGEFIHPDSKANKEGMIDIISPLDLKFDSDANWQFEALEHIYKKGYDWSIQSGNYCNINNPEGEEIISINIDPKEGSAVFEALYEISKILK